MTVKDLLTITGGNTKFYINGTTEKQSYVQLAFGKVDDIKFPCFLQALFGEKCKIFLENVASPNWRKLQGLGWQLFCQLHSHCRPYLVVIA